MDEPPTWMELFPSGAPPLSRRDHSAIYEPIGQTMIVVGGFRLGEGALDEVWRLSLSGSPSWSPVSYGGPSPGRRYGHSTVYDSERGAMVIFGGTPNGGLYRMTLDGAAIGSPLPIPGLITPVPRWNHSAVYDPVSDSMILFGGWNGDHLSDLWSLPMSGALPWEELPEGVASPLARSSQATTFDPAKRQLLLFGGNATGIRGDAWAFWVAARAWSQVASPMPTPGGRSEHSMILDSQGDRLVVFAGRESTTSADVWTLDLQTMAGWTNLTVAGSPPTARGRHSAIFDPERRRMIIFGGYDGGYLNDTWELSLAGTPEWDQVFPEGSPPPARYGHSAIYDPLRDRMIIFGGAEHNLSMGDVWALSLGGAPAWSQIPAQSGQPLDRAGHQAVYDPVGDRMIVYGGSSGGFLADVWELPLDGSPVWAPLSIQGQAPAARTSPLAIYDPGFHRILVIGGFGGTFLGDVWALALTGPLTWNPLSPAGTLPSPRSNSAGVYDMARERVVLFGGQGANDTFFRDTWTLSSPVTVGIGVEPRIPPTPVLSHVVHPNPVRSSAVIQYDLSEETSLTVEIFDAAGRLVDTLFRDPSVPAGRHTIRWTGKNGAGKRLPSGMYLYRLVYPRGDSVGKIILLE